MDVFDYASFGEVLKALRKKKKVSQQDLANKLGVHRNTIGAWERGEHLPDGRGMVLELARILHMDAQEARHLLEASLTAIVPYWNIPALRNPLFTGRAAILETLHTYLSTAQAETRTQSYALHGLGGIGKTQLAVEYAYRYALEYSAIFWIGAESVETITTSLLSMAELLKLPERHETDQQQIIAAVQRWLITHREWLLIWDNLEDVALLQRFLPPARQGAILITTRSAALGTLAHTLELLPMTPEESTLLLLRRAKVLRAPSPDGQNVSMPTEDSAAQTLIQIMGGLPLALDQAGAYIDETGCSLADYLQRYEQQRAQLLARRGTLGGDHPHSVTATFRLAHQRLEQEQPMAADVLRVCASLHAESIPEEIFVAGAAHLGPMLATLAADPYHLDVALAALRSFSLLQRQTETRTLSIHRLVQVVLHEQMAAQEQAQWQQRVLQALNTLLPKVTTVTVPREAWKQCARLLPHALVCTAAVPDHAGNQTLVEVLLKVADYLREIGQYAQAEPLYQRTIAVGEHALGAEHPLVAAALNNLATTYRALEKYEQAEQLYRRALPIRERLFSPDYPSLASSLANLAAVYKEQQKFEQAEPLYQQALDMRVQIFGSDHVEIALYLHEMADFYYAQGKYAEAERLYRRVLAICEQTLGPEHLNVARPLKGLADLYAAQGKYAQAELFYRRVLEIRDQYIGQNHPETAPILHDFAKCLQQQEKLAEATACLERAQEICAQSLGPLHAKTVAVRTSYLALLRAQGQEEQAATLERAWFDARDGEPEQPLTGASREANWAASDSGDKSLMSSDPQVHS